ncbi:DUF6961 family protein [Sphingomonas hengshuiensis]|nr:hypothetical protein [Sphingomonas hengshuiensis]
MVDERELWACANQVIRQHGAEASSFAKKRAEELLRIGDQKGNAVFLAIATRVDQLECLVAPGTPH